ncbi:hypothetical protein F5B22DRAFT_50671 [Xylaria bambusicola]|uniref:uncharacterized protein n=1 Tax=Xylaria bambusicola TaxID=326684 RepID=UPI002007B961|nr:uncharacterized protein F5B22DRAFT_50671 [Xylaria bambusicola]KAI0520754.1 hypothetical protein F5B22DRAFT_50671 [Xylaria bambusicola]
MEPTTLPDRVLKRRAQNASAQRIYREKQKKKMQRLEALTIAALASSSSPFTGDAFDMNNHDHETAEQNLLQSPTLVPSEQPLNPAHCLSLIDQYRHQSNKGQVTISGLPGHAVLSLDLFPRIHALLTSITPRERRTFQAVTIRERFGIRDIIKYGLIKLGYAMNPLLFENAKHASTRAWLGQVRAVIGDDVDIMAVLAAGVKLLASLPIPSSILCDDWDDNGRRGDEEEVMRRIVFSPRESNMLNNRVTLATVSLGSAFFANALMLGIPIPSMMDYEDVVVPPQALLCTKPDLVPTAAQLAIPHHPSFDVIPWPAFRSNVCLALAHNPPLVDDDELCLDLMNDGVRCWGSVTVDSMHGRGQGAPWDQRSWEAAPWFLEKWKMLTDDDMWRNSEWWRNMRG